MTANCNEWTQWVGGLRRESTKMTACNGRGWILVFYIYVASIVAIVHTYIYISIYVANFFKPFLGYIFTSRIRLPFSSFVVLAAFWGFSLVLNQLTSSDSCNDVVEKYAPQQQ